MKRSIRKIQLRQRKHLSKMIVAADSAAIFRHVIHHDAVRSASCIHLYYPINNEVDTIEFIEYAWSRDIAVLMPRTDFENHCIVNYHVTSFAQLEETTFGMMEPRTDCEKAEAEPDVIIVPGVCFDLQGNRMGYGGGFYDRFLQQTSAYKIAPAYEFQVLSHIPTEAHDIKMDCIITVQGVVFP